MGFGTKFILSLILAGIVWWFVRDWTIAGIAFIIILVILLLFFRKKKLNLPLKERAERMRKINARKTDLVRTFENQGITREQFDKLYSQLDSEAKRLMAA